MAKRKASRSIGREERERIVTLRAAGMSWRKLSAELGVPESTARGIYKRETGPVSEVAKPVEPAGPLEARVLKSFPNPRLICIYFGERSEENFAKCVVKPRASWLQHKKVLVLPVEGGDELYRLERDF